MSTAFALITLAESSEAPTSFLLFKAGENDTEKGKFFFTEDSAKLLMENQAKWGNDYSFDYEHQAVNSSTNGTNGPTPAAGWYSLKIIDGALWAVNIRWTDIAKKLIETKQYRYVSPAFYSDTNNTIVEYLNAALTNIPATRNMTALIAASKLAIGDKTNMDYVIADDIAAKLQTQMDAVSYEGDMMAYVTDIINAFLAEVAADAAEAPVEAETPVAAAKVEEPVAEACAPKKLSSITELSKLSSEVISLRAELDRRDRKDIVAKIVASGKALPAQQKFLESLSVVQLSEWEKVAPVVLNRTSKEPSNEDVFDGKTLQEWVKSDVGTRMALSKSNPALYETVRKHRESIKA